MDEIEINDDESLATNPSRPLLDNEENTAAKSPSTRLTRHQLVATILLLLYFFLSSAYYSLFAPFFPAEAVKKGINQTQVGMIFGVLQLVLLILSPYFGKYVT
jgi:cyanate permease